MEAQEADFAKTSWLLDENEINVSPAFSVGDAECFVKDVYSYSWSCVLSGGAPTLAGTSMFTMWKISILHTWSVKFKHNGDMHGNGAFMAYNGWGIMT